MKKILFTAILFVAAVFAPAQGQKQSGQEIFSKLEHQLDGLNDYTVNLTANISMEGLRVPRMNAKLSFKQPDKIHFEAEGFAMMPREWFGVTPAALTKKYKPEVAGTESVDGVDAIRVRCIPKSDSIPDQHLVVWVDPARWVVVKIEISPYRGRTLAIDATFMKVQDRWWLPATMKMNFNGGGAPDRNQSPPGMDQQSGRQRQPPQTGSIELVYSGYAVNQNLPDSLFEKKDAPRH